MKKFLSIVVVLAMASGVVCANVDKPKAATGMAVVKSNSGFKLFYRGTNSGNVKVSIINSKGEQVFKETLHNVESFVRPYNMSSLGEDEYTVQLTSSDGKLIDKVAYTKETMADHVRVVAVKNSPNKFLMSLANKTGAENVEVKIYDKDNNLVFQQSEKVSGDFAKVYSLKQLRDHVIFEVTTDNGVSTSFVSNIQ